MHFAVAVISDGTKTIEELLAPYQENNCGTVPRELLEFVDTEEDERAVYESGGCTYVFMPDGRRLFPWDETFRVEGTVGLGSATHKVPECLEQRSIPYRDTFETFDDYMKWAGEERDPETGRYGFWENPNAKWDWWTIGGRWRAQVCAVDGECAPYTTYDLGDFVSRLPENYPAHRFDRAKLRDMIWEADEGAAAEAELDWRAWVDGEEIDRGARWHRGKRFLLRTFGDKEGYALCSSTMWWGAVVTPDGKWHELGSLGMADHDAETGATVEWAKSFKGRFIDPWPTECVLTVVDCHV